MAGDAEAHDQKTVSRFRRFAQRHGGISFYSTPIFRRQAKQRPLTVRLMNYHLNPLGTQLMHRLPRSKLETLKVIQ